MFFVSRANYHKTSSPEALGFRWGSDDHVRCWLPTKKRVAYFAKHVCDKKETRYMFCAVFFLSAFVWSLRHGVSGGGWGGGGGGVFCKHVCDRTQTRYIICFALCFFVCVSVVSLVFTGTIDAVWKELKKCSHEYQQQTTTFECL